MTNVVVVHVESCDRSGRTVNKRKRSLERASARARNIEGGQFAVRFAHIAVKYVVTIYPEACDFPRQVDAPPDGTLPVSGARPWNVILDEVPLRSSQQADGA